jgi:hypothetical protein
MTQTLYAHMNKSNLKKKSKKKKKTPYSMLTAPLGERDCEGPLQLYMWGN